MACLELAQVLHQQLRFKGGGVVVVDLGPLFVGLALLALVVAVVADDGDGVTKVLFQVPGQGGFPGAGAAGDADEDGIHATFSLPRYLETKSPHNSSYYTACAAKPQEMHRGDGENSASAEKWRKSKNSAPVYLTAERKADIMLCKVCDHSEGVPLWL